MARALELGEATQSPEKENATHNLSNEYSHGQFHLLCAQSTQIANAPERNQRLTALRA